MASHVVQFTGLPDHEREQAEPLPKLAAGDHVELHVHGRDGNARVVPLPPAAAVAVEGLLAHLLSGGRVAVLAEEQEVSPSAAAAILGISRPLVVLRMDRGDLPFRYVGKHRRASLENVLALKIRLDAQRQAVKALAEDAEDLHARYGI